MSTSYTAGSEIKITLPLTDEDGNQIDAVSYSYTLYNEAGASVEANSGAVPAGMYDLELIIPAGSNTVAAGERYGARQLVCIVTDDDGDTHQIIHTYILRAHVFLSVPSESAQTLMQSMILTKSMSQAVLENWNYADEEEREAALIEAWSRLYKIRYNPWLPTDTPPDDLYELQQTGKLILNQVTVDQWNALPDHFRLALRRAQIVEAGVLLGGDPVFERRMDGLLSKTVGESSEMFRSAAPIKSVISPKARREIGQYIDTSYRIGRA
jgi:hypothetical protein